MIEKGRSHVDPTRPLVSTKPFEPLDRIARSLSGGRYGIDIITAEADPNAFYYILPSTETKFATIVKPPKPKTSLRFTRRTP